MHYSITPLGDQGLLIDFGGGMDERTNRKVLHLFQKLQQAQLPFVTDLVPAFTSLGVYYDSCAVLHEYGGSAYDFMVRSMHPFLTNETAEPALPARRWEIPVCYAGSFGWDLEAIAAEKNMATEQVVQLHTKRNYRVYMIGFLPGFAYMGSVDERIAVPRKTTPREMIPAGSVGIAGQQTGIYPLVSPGGWQIIGRTPIRLFDNGAAAPVLLSPGDEVTFYSISEDEFENYPGRHL